MIICWKYVRGINVESISIQWKMSGRYFYYEIPVGNLFLFFVSCQFQGVGRSDISEILDFFPFILISYLHWKVLDQIYVLHCNSVLFFLKSAKGKENFGKSVEIRIKLLKIQWSSYKPSRVIFVPSLFSADSDRLIAIFFIFPILILSSYLHL